MLRSSFSYIAFWNRRKDFNCKHVLHTWRCLLCILVWAIRMHLLFPLIKAVPGLLQAYHSWTGTTLHKALISCLPWETISKKVRQPSLLAFLRLPSLANSSTILLPLTLMCKNTIDAIVIGIQEIEMLDSIYCQLASMFLPSR